MLEKIKAVIFASRFLLWAQAKIEWLWKKTTLKADVAEATRTHDPSKLEDRVSRRHD